MHGRIRVEHIIFLIEMRPKVYELPSNNSISLCFVRHAVQLDRYEQKVLKRENSISISYKTKVAKMLFIVVVIFIGLHIPFTALIFIRNKLLKNSTMNQVDGGFYMLWYTAHYLLYLNSAVNPIIYGLTNDNFRRAYYQTPLLPRRLRSCLADVVKLLPTKVNKLYMCAYIG